MELFFYANKIFVPFDATKAPDISCFIYNFSGSEGVKKTQKQYIASGDVPKNCLSFKWDKDAAQYSLGLFQVLELAGALCDWKWDGKRGLGT